VATSAHRGNTSGAPHNHFYMSDVKLKNLSINLLHKETINLMEGGRERETAREKEKEEYTRTYI
jgi:hypothetical protein